MKQIKNKLIQSFAILILLLICGILPIFNFNVYAADAKNEAENLLSDITNAIMNNSGSWNSTAGQLTITVPAEYGNIGIQGFSSHQNESGLTIYDMNLNVHGGDMVTASMYFEMDSESHSCELMPDSFIQENGEYKIVFYNDDMIGKDIADYEPSFEFYDHDLSGLEGVGEEPEPEPEPEPEQEPEPENIKGEIAMTFQQAGPLEMTLSQMCLAVGDHLMEYLTFLLKEEVTIDKIIFNRVDALNANFFTNSTNPSNAPATKFVRDAVNYWYAFLGKIVIIIYMIALIAVGVMIMLGGVARKVNAQEILMKWTMGIIIFYFFPYVMKYAFEINEAMLAMISEYYMANELASPESYLGGALDLAKEEMEERSPEYVSRQTYLLTLGSEEATKIHIDRINKYSDRADLMRLMRALAGVTARMFYVILWFIMIYQLLAFIYIYYKRYLMIAFLIMIFPVTLISYVMGTVSTGKVSSLSSWCKEFFTNVFLQTIHAIIYGIVTGVIINQIKDSLATGEFTKINWFIWIVVINFIFTGEKIMKGIMNAGSAESVKSLGDVASSGRGTATKAFGKVKGMFSK